ncbi:MAG TPA: hypothetical protein VJO16_08900 [Candidatus Acidoferrum sp.]|nr:hypothetical protein [Candidatus Acidoferrum sp.]
MKRFAVLSALLLFSSFSHAQDVTSAPARRDGSAAGAEDARMKALEDQVRSLAGEVALLRSELKELRETKSPEQLAGSQLLLASSHLEPGMLSSSPVPAAPQTTQTQTFGGASGNAKLLNPDISLIGDFIGTAGHNTVSPSPSLQMHETEIGMQAIIDPYARADAFLSFGETGVNVEEAYITFTSLPAGLLLKVGKMRAAFGKVNTIHNHALSFIDRPLATNNLIGGEDGIDDAGISLSRFLPAPKNWFLEGTAQVFRGDSDSLFSAYRSQDLSVVGHLRAYRDLSESTNLDLGVSYSRGNSAGLGLQTASNPSAFFTDLYAADATLRWKPLRRAIYHAFLFRNEFFWSARDQLSPANTFQTQHAFGFYSNAEYRVNRRWTVGGRFDRSGHATDARLTDTGFSGILTYWPSEFSQIRGQYRFGHLATTPTDFSNANELLFQFLFVMGAHGAHPF